MLGGIGEGVIASILVSLYRRVFPSRWEHHGATVKFFAVGVAAAICATLPGLVGGATAFTILKTAGTAFMAALTTRQVVKRGPELRTEVGAIPKKLAEKISLRTKPPSL